MDEKTKYKFLANLVMTVHLIWVILMLFSIPIVIMFPATVFIYLFFIISMLFIWSKYGGCFITDWEKSLIKKYDETKVYEGTFIVYYLEKFFKIKARKGTINMITYALAVFLVVYAIFTYLL